MYKDICYFNKRGLRLTERLVFNHVWSKLKRVAQLFTHESRHSQDAVLSADQCADGVLRCEGTLRAITSAAVECTRQIRGRLGAGAVWTKHPLWPTITPYCFPQNPSTSVETNTSSYSSYRSSLCFIPHNTSFVRDLRCKPRVKGSFRTDVTINYTIKCSVSC